MKNALVAKGPNVTVNDVPIPKSAAEYCEAHDSDDIAGIVESVGYDVVELKKGDRVAAFHKMMSPPRKLCRGANAMKFAQASNVHPIIAIASRVQGSIENFITRGKGDATVDYREADEAVVTGIKEGLKKVGAGEVKFAFNAVSEQNSFQNISQALSNQGRKIT
ncbi:unnamed protein product [Diplocarpon coronariae]